MRPDAVLEGSNYCLPRQQSSSLYLLSRLVCDTVSILALYPNLTDIVSYFRLNNGRWDSGLCVTTVSKEPCCVRMSSRVEQAEMWAHRYGRDANNRGGTPQSQSWNQRGATYA